MNISDFDYKLPEKLIAQTRVNPPESAKMMVLGEEEISHKHIFDLPDFLREGDILVLNNTKVFKVRLMGKKIGVKGVAHEVLLLRPLGDGNWAALLQNARRAQVGTMIDIAGAVAEVIKVPVATDPQAVIKFQISNEEVFALADRAGDVPVPPYIERQVELNYYQTTYAQDVGSAAAPTAGLHFSQGILQQIRARGIQIESITLHVGLGTFMPVKADTLEEHKMHSEFVKIEPAVAQRINSAKREKRRVIAVGTTVVRALEGAAAVAKATGGRAHCVMPLPVYGYEGEVDLFIKPGFEFRVVDALLTNFHLPKSTLLALVSAFAGRERILSAYKQAINNGYRFYSFGDAMFIENKLDDCK